MIFLNKTTNLTWEITDKEHIEMLLKDSNYQAIDKETVLVDYKKLSFKELQELAKEKGLKYIGVKKESLIELLKEGEHFE